MTNIYEYIYMFLVFPGFLFSAAMGLAVGWVDRKLTARLQWRVGPPWYQNYIDILKLLFYKETLVPEGSSRSVFLGMPLIALSGATLVSAMVFAANISRASGFAGDIVVIVYLAMVPALALILGAFASANTLASLGASRETKLMLSYELPFILAIVVPIIKAGGTIRLGEIISYQSMHAPFILSISGAVSFTVMLLSIQAKLGMGPFDIAEAETEIMAGPYIEYSGKALAMFKLAKTILTFAMPALLITLYFGGIGCGPKGVAVSAAEYLFIVAVMIVIKNTNPRVRIDQAMAFFWRPLTTLAAVSVILAYFGI